MASHKLKNGEGLHSERKIAEEALRESEERYRLLAENVTDVIWTIDMDLRFTYVSPSVTRQIGYSVEEAMALSLEEILTSASFEITLKAFTEEMAIENMEQKDLSRSRTLELEQCCKDGSIIWTELEVTFLRDSNGNANGILAVSRDITERKRAEEALRESQERLQDFLDDANDLVQSVAPDDRLLYVNRKWRETLGYTEGEIAGLSLFDIIHPDSLAHCKEVFQRVIAGERVNHIEAKFVAKDGGVIMVEGSANCRFEDGKPVATRGIFRDITERKTAEEEKLRAVTEKAAVLDSMGEGLLIIDMEGKVISCNPAFVSLSGYTEGDLAGKDAADLINVLVKVEDQQRLVANFTAALTTRIVGTEYFSLISRNGREIPVATTETLTVDEEGNPISIIAMFKDITSIREAEIASRESEEKLRCFMDSATDQFTIWDSELNLVDLNEAALKYPLIRLSDEANKEDFIGKNIAELEPHVKERGRYDQYLAVIETGEPLLIEDVISNPRLGDIHLSVKAFKVGNGLGMITTDITESKRAERALRESEQRYRLLADNVTDIITIADLNLQVIYVSPSIERLLGYSVEEAMAETMEYFLTPASLDAAMEAMAEEIATRNQEHKQLFWTRTLEMEMTCKDGSTIWTENIVSPLRDQNSKIIGIVGVTRDIRERKRAELALRESEEKLRRFMDSATDFFTIWDSELNLLDLN
ncbi:MAG: PAS domain S-box protein, partial [Dehalococcoidia bacterium]|nr:PAS domain S-box protein [Dehalococcoidia bacterium]